ncbi:MAG: Kelch repeat-containing protein, partial [Endomicrobiales bacterium]
DGCAYLFGGRGASLLQDLWSYDAASGNWQSRGAAPVSARENATMFFDARNGELVLFGGGDVSGDCGDLWYYNHNDNTWKEGFPANAPLPRHDAGAAYVPGLDKAVLFGGYGVEAYAETYFFVYRSTGLFTSRYLNVPGSGPLKWMTLEMSPLSQPAGTTVKFQVASSTDNIAWDDFRGGDGGTASFYEGTGPHTLSAVHADRRYLRYRAFLASGKKPNSPLIDSVTVTYDQSPSAPALYTPLNGGSTGQVSPVFTWYNAADPEGDALTYHLQADNGNAFSSPEVDAPAVSSGNYTTSYVSTTTLRHGAWYWRVRAFDGSLYGNWSVPFTLFVDTAPPAAVTDLAAETGFGNGALTLTWTSPGNDASSGSILNGSYQVRLATFPITDEAAYASAARQSQGSLNCYPGLAVQAGVYGLDDDTTYYAVVKIGDDAGNLSPLSKVSGPARTNAPPHVVLASPLGGETWSREKDVSWTSWDGNPGDTRVFSLYASSDAGAYFNLSIATGLAQGTTFYRWNTRQAANGAWRVKVTAVDARGLSGEAISGDITISNENEAPAVTVLFPRGGERLSGAVTLLWSVDDANLSDTHASDIFLSADGGASFPWHFTTAAHSFTLDTASLPNGPGFLLRVSAVDPGLLSGEDVSGVFSVDNGNLPPRAFSLVAPADGSSRSPLNFELVWENAGDPNPADTLAYTLYYSTRSDLSSRTEIRGVAGDRYQVEPALLAQETTYSWYVSAADPLGLARVSRQVFRAFVLSRSKTESADGRIIAEITRGLPENGFLKIEPLVLREASSLQEADREGASDRQMKLLGVTPYRLSVCDISGRELETVSPRLSLTIRYEDGDNNGYYDGTLVPSENLRCAVLNEATRRWESLPALPAVDRQARKLTASLDRLGTVTLVGRVLPSRRLSGITNFPNPFAAGRQETRIRYVLTEDADVTVRVYTLLGGLVWERACPAAKEGGRGQPTGYTNEISWDGRTGQGQPVANGMYLLEIKTGSDALLRKIGVIK